MALPVPETVTLKNPKDFRIIGRPTQRLDAQAKTSGRQDFGIDMRLPGQLTAVVARPPVFGGRLASVDDSAARAVKGVKAVLRVPLDGGAEGVAVVADGYWQATQGRDALKLEWDTSSGREGRQRAGSSRSTANWPGSPARASSTPTWRRWRRRPGNSKPSSSSPISRMRAMEPLNCTVRLADDRAEIWMGSQCAGLDAGCGGDRARPQAGAGRGQRADGGRRLRPALLQHQRLSRSRPARSPRRRAPPG